MDPRERRRTAHHEAGHAVVAVELGARITSMGLPDQASGRGWCNHTPLRSRDDNVCVCLAGVTAEVLAGYPQPAWHSIGSGPNDDGPAALAYFRGMHPDIQAAAMDCEASRAGRILRRRWATVQALAAELERRGQLGASQVAAILVSQGMAIGAAPPLRTY